MKSDGQEHIRKTSLRHGIQESPVFDNDTEGYAWQKCFNLIPSF